MLGSKLRNVQKYELVIKTFIKLCLKLGRRTETRKYTEFHPFCDKKIIAHFIGVKVT